MQENASHHETYFRGVISIPDIRERKGRQKNKQPKHQTASTVQRQMVQKFVKELGDSAKQPDRSDSAERTATEQVETIVREVAPFPRKAHHRTNAPHTRPERPQPQSKPIPAPQEQARRAHAKQAKKSRAEKPSAWDNLYTEQPEIRLADSSPQKEVPAIREKSKAPEIRSQVHSKTTPAKPSTVRHEKQPDAWTPRSSAAPVMRGKEQSIRERSAVTQARDLSPTPQEQARQAFMEKQAQLAQNPSIESIYPSEPAAPIPPQPPVSDAPTITPERQPVTAGGKPAPPVQPPPTQSPPAERPPAIREKPKPNAAPREKNRRGVSIRTRDTEQITPPTVQPKTSVSKIDVGVKRSFVRAVFR